MRENNGIGNAEGRRGDCMEAAPASRHLHAHRPYSVMQRIAPMLFMSHYTTHPEYRHSNLQAFAKMPAGDEAGDGGDGLTILVAHAHDRAFAELAFDLTQGRGQGALLVLVH